MKTPPFSFLHCAVVIFGLLILSRPAEAMPRVYPHLSLSPFGESTYYNFTHNAAAGLRMPAAPCAVQNVAAQEPVAVPVESHRQSPLKTDLLNLTLRGSLSSTDVIGADAPEEFRAYDVTATFRLPVGWYSESGWGAGIRLMTGAGALTGGGETGLVLSLTPLLAFGSRDGRFTLDMGAGAALFSRHTFGTQDFGGLFQFTLTAGIGVPLFKNLGAGYRYVHYSDASLYGDYTTGADMHMLEIIYRF